MKYLSEEKIQIQTISKRQVEYIRCDKCGKKIIPREYKEKENRYIHVHTWHHDWGHDSVESHEYYDYCMDCSKEAIVEYINNIPMTGELELSHEYLTLSDTYQGKPRHSDGYSLVSEDKQ